MLVEHAFDHLEIESDAPMFAKLLLEDIQPPQLEASPREVPSSFVFDQTNGPAHALPDANGGLAPSSVMSIAWRSGSVVSVVHLLATIVPFIST